jgi:hypothetical protein
VPRSTPPATIAAVPLRKKNKPATKKRSRLRALPWAALLQIAVVVRSRWLAVPAKDRARFVELLRESQGRAGNLSSRQREELRKVVRKFDLKGAAAELAAIVRGGGKRKRR